MNRKVNIKNIKNVMFLTDTQGLLGVGLVSRWTHTTEAARYILTLSRKARPGRQQTLVYVWRERWDGLIIDYGTANIAGSCMINYLCFSLFVSGFQCVTHYQVMHMHTKITLLKAHSLSADGYRDNKYMRWLSSQQCHPDLWPLKALDASVRKRGILI